MRELIFRGKSVYDGEWVSGMNIFLCCNKERTEFAGWMTQRGTHVTHTPVDTPDGRVWRHSTEGVEVDVETIGQYTGLTDKNGVKIFEGDILEINGYYGLVSFGKDLRRKSIGFHIVWAKHLRFRSDLCFWVEEEQAVVVGNIYDSPELFQEDGWRPMTAPTSGTGDPSPTEGEGTDSSDSLKMTETEGG